MSILADYWNRFQSSLFRHLENVLEEPLSERLQQFVRILEIVRIEQYVVSPYSQWMGRKQTDRRSMARAFIAKAVYDLPTTEILIEMLYQQSTLRRLCGFERRSEIPSASTFSRAFAEFAQSKLGDKVHEALVRTYVGQSVIMHVSRDSTEVAAREKPVKKEKPAPKPKRKSGRPKKGEEPPRPEPTRLEKQLNQSPEEALAEVRRVCDIGAKRDAKGNFHYWIGWKAHIDWADGGIPLNVVTTSASVHDSQVAIPMARITARRALSFYDLMDPAYDAPQIRQVSQDLGHVAIIQTNKRRGEAIPMEPDRARRYNERTTAERGNSRLKDEFGFRHLRVRGHAKAHMHLMFGILALFADQLYKVFSG
jgi:IS5 family transposase